MSTPLNDKDSAKKPLPMPKERADDAKTGVPSQPKSELTPNKLGPPAQAPKPYRLK